MDTGNEVLVNPSAAGHGVVLYPGGQYMRVVPQLLEPGQTYGPIHLHMPTHHRAVRRPVTAAAASPAPDATVAPAPKPKPRRIALAAPPKPAPAPSDSVPPGGGFGPPPTMSLFGGPPVSLAPSKPAAPPKPAPNTQIAKANPAPIQSTPGLTKRSVILFAKDATDPAESALGAIKFLAGDLNSAMVGPSTRVEIQAFGGAHGDKGSDARRLSLKRALAIRQVLIDDGVPSERIDVRAMGGVDDTGPSDRVDVYVKA